MMVTSYITVKEIESTLSVAGPADSREKCKFLGAHLLTLITVRPEGS